MTVTLLATEISGLAVQTYNSGNVNRLYVDTISSNLSNWKKGVGGIYYSGEVSIGHSTFDCGDYNFQVSGDTYLSGTVVFRGTGISGLADPIYPSAACNKHYVDTISSNLNSKVGTGGITGWYDLDTGTGITSFNGAVAISGTQAETLSVDDYIASSNVVSNFIASGGVHNAFSSQAISSNAGLFWDVTIVDDLNLGDGLVHYGDDNTYINFNDDEIVVVVSGGHYITIDGVNKKMKLGQQASDLVTELYDEVGMRVMYTNKDGIWIDWAYIDAQSISSNNISGGSLHIGPDTIINDIDTDDTLAADSDSSLATQKAIKKYVDDNASFDSTLYITSSSAIDRFADSSNINSRFYGSGATIHSNYIMSSAKFTTVADTGNDGYLSSTDWNTFNSKGSLGDMTWNVPTQASGVVLVGDSGISGNMKVTLRDIPQDVIKSGANWQTAYDERVSETHGTLLDWAGGALNVDLTELTYNGDSLVSSEDMIMYLDDGLPRKKWLYETNLSAFLNDEGWQPGATISSNFFLVGSGNTLWTNAINLSGNYYGHSSNKDIHYPSSNLTGWLDNVYLLNSEDDTMDGILTADGFVTAGGISSSAISSAIATFTSISLGSNISHIGDTDTRIQFTDNRIEFDAGNATFITLEEDPTQDYMLLGSAGGDIDLYMYAGADALLSIDAGNKTLNIKNASISSTSLSGGSVTINAINYDYPPMTYNVANVFISANSNLNIARFNTGVGKKCYLWQAACCNSGGASISGLKIELLSGSTSKYWTSSAIVKQDNPLVTTEGNIEIRMMYSGGASLTGHQFGTSFMNVSVY